jgi:hypothetical protein
MFVDVLKASLSIDKSYACQLSKAICVDFEKTMFHDLHMHVFGKIVESVFGMFTYFNITSATSSTSSTSTTSTAITTSTTTVDGINSATLWLIALVRFALPLPNNEISRV